MSLCVCVYTTYIYIYMLSIQVVWELFPLWTIVNSAAMSIFHLPPHPTFTMHSTKLRGMDTSPVSLTSSVLCLHALV